MERILDNGLSVRVRPIRPDDKVGLSDALARLSAATVHRRFLAPKRRFSSTELRYLTEVDGRDHVALVAELPDAPGTLIAVGRWVRHPDEPHSAEFAIVVADEHQGIGLGSLLADDLAATAKDRGVRRFTASTLADNDAIVRVMQRLSNHLERRRDAPGVAEMAFDLAA